MKELCDLLTWHKQYESKDYMTSIQLEDWLVKNPNLNGETLVCQAYIENVSINSMSARVHGSYNEAGQGIAMDFNYPDEDEWKVKLKVNLSMSYDKSDLIENVMNLSKGGRCEFVGKILQSKYSHGGGESFPYRKLEVSLKLISVKKVIGYWINPPTKSLIEEKNNLKPLVKSNQNSGCFIATAAFASDEVKEVAYLRNFKNTILEETPLGRSFIHFYYTFSPTIANVIKHIYVLRIFTRTLLRYILIPILKYFYQLESNIH